MGLSGYVLNNWIKTGGVKAFSKACSTVNPVGWFPQGMVVEGLVKRLVEHLSH
jgi:hypothetical protein